MPAPVKHQILQPAPTNLSVDRMTTSPVRSLSKASPDSPGSTAFSTDLVDVEVKPSLPPEERVRRPGSSLRSSVILGTIFVLLLLGIAGAGACHYYSNYARSVQASSASRTPSTHSRSKSLLKAATLSRPETDAVSVSPIQRMQSVLKENPRSFAVTVLAVILAVGLIATVAVLVRVLNAPPQVLEKDVIVNHHDTTNGPAGNSMPPGGIAAVVLCVVFFVASIVVLILAKSKKLGVEQNITTQQIPQPIPLPNINYLSAIASSDPFEIGFGIEGLFDAITRMVQPAKGRLHITKVDADHPGAANFGYYLTLGQYFTDHHHKVDHHVDIIQDWTPCDYFFDMVGDFIFRMRSFRQNPDSELGYPLKFILVVEDSRTRCFLEPDTMVRSDATFSCIGLEDVAGVDKLWLRIIFQHLLIYKERISMHLQGQIRLAQ